MFNQWAMKNQWLGWIQRKTSTISCTVFLLKTAPRWNASWPLGIWTPFSNAERGGKARWHANMGQETCGPWGRGKGTPRLNIKVAIGIIQLAWFAQKTNEQADCAMICCPTLIPMKSTGTHKGGIQCIFESWVQDCHHQHSWQCQERTWLYDSLRLSKSRLRHGLWSVVWNRFDTGVLAILNKKNVKDQISGSPVGKSFVYSE